MLGKEAASLLKRLTDAAHTAVSRLGNTLITTFFPFSSFRDNSDKSLFTPLKSGASAPTAGNEPFVFTALPLNVIFAIFVVFYVLRYKRLTNISRFV